ncbi:hypothetical protein CHUAL_004995 [Chamberlinius hualienensis]
MDMLNGEVSMRYYPVRTILKRLLQGGTILSLLAYTTLVLLQYGGGANTALSSPIETVVEYQHHKLSLSNELRTDQLYNKQSSVLTTMSSEEMDMARPNVNSNSLTRLDDIFISVKTTKKFHKNRVDVILKTWFNSAKDQTYFFTDDEDKEFERRTGGHMINTNCTASHNRKALCCKMSVEFDTYLESNKMWFCHFDDDNYVNVPRLVQLLQGFNPQEDWYLGKTSIRAPLSIMNRDNPKGPNISFWFATGGAGFCISRALALKMMPIASNGKFISIGDKIRLPDDVTVGYIIEHLLNVNLTVIKEFHSHLEHMKFINPESFSDQITFSYSKHGKELNIINIDGLGLTEDATRFLSLHCHYFPDSRFCP